MSNFPEEFDTNENLYEVHDSLRMRLAEDYTPGDTSITVFGDEEIMSRFSDMGIITLTDQCSDPSERAISFTYTSKTTTTFDGLELLDGFTDVAKSKNITNITQNVMAEHHNSLKDAVIAIEECAGIKDEVSLSPLQGTMEARTNYLRSIALSPKAWFSVDKTVGLVPLTITVKDLSFQLGTDGTAGTVTYTWDFGDGSSPSVIVIEPEDDDPITGSHVLVRDLNGGELEKIYSRPGIYDITLTVENDFGEDTVTFYDIISARIPAPDEAVIKFIPRTSQIATEGDPEDGPYDTNPYIRLSTDNLLDIEVPSGTNPNTGRTYGGVEFDEDGNQIDPIISYTWSLADDLAHTNSSSTRASYSVGGIYDLILRVDTQFGGYRITTYEDSIDVVEKINLWLWLYDGANTVSTSEFGLISEVFKTQSTSSLSLNMDDSFLDDASNEEQQKREFARNNGFAQRGTTTSGSSGVGLLYWASGRGEAEPITNEDILMSEFNGFTQTYSTQSPISRPWNWVAFPSSDNIYFILGGVTTTILPNESPTNQTKSKLALSDTSVTSTTLASSNYKNGANELTENQVTFDDDGDPIQGHMSVYRSAWHADTGYLLRNESVGVFFRIKDFYKTSGNSSEPFNDIRKLQDMGGPAKIEGQLVSLSKGVYFFNNSGSISAYNTTTNVWETGGPGVNSASFRLLQDTSVIDFDNSANTLIAASDGDRVVYLSYDYSTSAFIKFNETDTTFASVTARPSGTQWQATIF